MHCSKKVDRKDDKMRTREERHFQIFAHIVMIILSALAVGGDSHYFIRKVQPKDDELSLDGKPQGVIPRYI